MPKVLAHSRFTTYTRYEKIKPKTSKVKDTTKDKLAGTLSQEFQDGYNSIALIRDTWDEKEAMMMGHVVDQTTKTESKSKVFDPRLSTIAFERMMRVTAQMSSGKIKLSKEKQGKECIYEPNTPKLHTP